MARSAVTSSKPGTSERPAADVAKAVAWLKRHATKRTRDGMARYGLPSEHALGVSLADIQVLAKQLGTDQALAQALWNTGIYEARLLTAFVADPERTTSAQMDRWRKEFDNWGICDTLCFKLFDRSPHAWKKVAAWSRLADEFGKRTAFALLASLALHDKAAADARFLACLPLIERAASDERNFVKKGVSWALRSVGRRNQALNDAAVGTARRLAASQEAAPRWVGKDALREITSPAVQARLRKAGRPR